jgi:hypothetical protein
VGGDGRTWLTDGANIYVVVDEAALRVDYARLTDPALIAAEERRIRNDLDARRAGAEAAALADARRGVRASAHGRALDLAHAAEAARIAADRAAAVAAFIDALPPDAPVEIMTGEPVWLEDLTPIAVAAGVELPSAICALFQRKPLTDAIFQHKPLASGHGGRSGRWEDRYENDE